jgi:transposase
LRSRKRARARARARGAVAAILEAQRGAGRRGKDDRNFIEAVLWWRRTGVPWRDLPECFGPWKTVFNRFDRWSKRGTAVVAIGCALPWLRI